MGGKWTKVDLPKDHKSAATSMLLLADGSVLRERDTGKNWLSLAPDDHGEDANGTWTAASSTQTPRLYCASAVLGVGRVLVADGEYAPKGGDDTSAVDIDNPPTNTGSQRRHPPAGRSWATHRVLSWPTARVLLGNIIDTRTVLHETDAGAGNRWIAAGNERSQLGGDVDSPADGSVLTVHGNPPTNKGSERYLSDIDAGSRQVDLVDYDLFTEIGPAVLLADGRVTAFGGKRQYRDLQPPAPKPTQGTARPVRTSRTTRPDNG